jgi:hypothetical protein
VFIWYIFPVLVSCTKKKSGNPDSDSFQQWILIVASKQASLERPERKIGEKSVFGLTLKFVGRNFWSTTRFRASHLGQLFVNPGNGNFFFFLQTKNWT